MNIPQNKIVLTALIVACFLTWCSYGICAAKPSGAELEAMIDKWEAQLKSKDASRVLNDIGMKYGFRILKNTKIVPVLMGSLNPLIDNNIRSEGEGEYLGQVAETLGHIGDKRAIPVLKKIGQPIAELAIKEIIEADYLKLVIKSNKNVYHVGEDITIDYELNNVNEKSLIVNRKWFEPGDHSLVIQDMAGKEYRAIFTDKTPRQQSKYIVLEAQKSFANKLKIVKNPNHNSSFDEWDYGIRVPDIYTITAKYNNYTDRVYDSNIKQYVYIDAWIGTVISDPIMIEIIE